MVSLAADADEQVISINETFRSLDGTLYLLTDPQIPGVPLGDVDDLLCIAGLVGLSKQMPGKKIVVVICEQDRFNKFKLDYFGSFVYNFCIQDSNQMEMIGETDFLERELSSTDHFLLHSPIQWTTLQKMNDSDIPPTQIYSQGNYENDWNLKHTIMSIKSSSSEIQDILIRYLTDIASNSYSSSITGGCKLDWRYLPENELSQFLKQSGADKKLYYGLGFGSIPFSFNWNTFLCPCLESDSQTGRIPGNPMSPASYDYLKTFYNQYDIPTTGYSNKSKGNTLKDWVNDLIHSGGEHHLIQCQKYLNNNEQLFTDKLLKEENRGLWESVKTLVNTKFTHPGSQKLFFLGVIVNIMIFKDWVITDAIPGRFLSKDEITKPPHIFNLEMYEQVYGFLSPPMWDLGNLLLVMTNLNGWTDSYMHSQMRECGHLVNEGLQILLQAKKKRGSSE